jgi:hypothetical protein
MTEYALWLSNPEVASSSIKHSGFEINYNAIDVRLFCPPDIFIPLSPNPDPTLVFLHSPSYKIFIIY